eukprot:tig00000663_g2993.t1
MASFALPSAAPLFPVAGAKLAAAPAKASWFGTQVFLSAAKGGEKKEKQVGVGSFDVPPSKRYGPFPPTWKKSCDD